MDVHETTTHAHTHTHTHTCTVVTKYCQSKITRFLIHSNSAYRCTAFKI